LSCRIWQRSHSHLHWGYRKKIRHSEPWLVDINWLKTRPLQLENSNSNSKHQIFDGRSA
jgi:hypothetical protein